MCNVRSAARAATPHSRSHCRTGIRGNGAAAAQFVRRRIFFIDVFCILGSKKEPLQYVYIYFMSFDLTKY